MPDVSMCDNQKRCPKRNECYRYRAIPGMYQSYVELDGICNESTDYRMLIEIKGWDNLREPDVESLPEVEI